MKRARDDNEPTEPSKRSFLRRAVGTLIGNPFNEDEYNQKQYEEKLKQLFINEKWAKLHHENTKKILEETMNNEKMHN